MDDREQLRQAFNSKFRFSYGDLPAEGMLPGRVCHIRIVMGNMYVVLEEEDGQEFLEFIWSSRMDDAGSHHGRVYSDGTMVEFPENNSLDIHESKFVTPWRQHGFAITNANTRETAYFIWLADSPYGAFADILTRLKQEEREAGSRRPR